MLDRVVQTIQRYHMLGRGMRLGVAVSGGADSVCLLHVLLELAPRWDLSLSVLHLDHRLRGAESDGDAEFVRSLAASLGLPVRMRQADVGGAPGNLEQAARTARLAFYREAMAGAKVDRVALGHTASDQAETVLYRLLRGAGSAGLAGIRPVTAEGLIRPLIAVDRCEVEQYLRDRSLPWREDSTNRSLQFARNRIRHQLLPRLARDWNPSLGRTLTHTADWALAEEDYWTAEINRLASQYLIESNGTILVRVDTLAALPLAATRRLVRRAIERVKGDLRGVDFSHISGILAIASRSRGSGCCEVPGIEVRRSLDWLCFAVPGSGPSTDGFRVPAVVPGITRIPGTEFAVSTELIEKTETSGLSYNVYNRQMGCLDWSGVSGPLEFRNWRPGDQYQPVGNVGEHKIKLLFQKARVPSWERRLWPILTDGVSILWTRRFGAAARFAANAGSQVVLVIREVRV